MQEAVRQQLPDLERRRARKLRRGGRPQGERPQQQVAGEQLHGEDGDVDEQQGTGGGRHGGTHCCILAESCGEDRPGRGRLRGATKGVQFRHDSTLSVLAVSLPSLPPAGRLRRIRTPRRSRCAYGTPGVRALHAGAGRPGADRRGAVRDAAGARGSCRSRAAAQLELAIAWVPSSAKRAGPDPVVMLAGGPGQSALEAFPTVAPAFRDVLRQRDVMLVDQRGTGRSNPLDCPQNARR